MYDQKFVMNECTQKNCRTKIKGTLSPALLQKFKISKTNFTATETYKYWPGFDKNYNASVMKLKKVLSLWYHQELTI